MSKNSQTGKRHVLFLRLVIEMMTITCGVFGLSSHYYLRTHDRYYKSKMMLLYSIFAMVTFMSVYLPEVYNGFLTGKLDLNNVNKLNIYMNIIAVICCYLTGLMLHERMPRFMNDADLTNTITFFNMTSKMISQPLLMVVVRGIIFPIIHEVVLIIRQQHNSPNKSFLWTFYHFLPTVLSQILPSCAYGVLEVWKMYLSGIIAKLQLINIEVNKLTNSKDLQLYKPFYRMQKFCDLADNLDGLLEKYMDVSIHVLQYANMYAIPILCALFCNMLGILVGFYVQYVAIADTLIDGKFFDAFNSMTNAVYLIIYIIQIVLLASTTNQNMTAIRYIGLLLQDINVDCVDARFKQSVDLFRLFCHVYRFKVTPLGLFEINISILHEIAASVIGFLLILIQSDLALRFS